MTANLTIFLICLSVLAAACYAIRRLSSTPARVAAVILALATLVGSLQPLVALLSEPQHASVDTVVPSTPPAATVSAPDQPAALSPEPTGTSASAGM